MHAGFVGAAVAGYDVYGGRGFEQAFQQAFGFRRVLCTQVTQVAQKRDHREVADGCGAAVDEAHGDCVSTADAVIYRGLADGQFVTWAQLEVLMFATVLVRSKFVGNCCIEYECSVTFPATPSTPVLPFNPAFALMLVPAAVTMIAPESMLTFPALPPSKRCERTDCDFDERQYTSGWAEGRTWDSP